MVEVLIRAMQNCAGRVWPVMKRMFSMLPAGAWIALAVVSLIGGRYFWVCSSRSPHLKEIAAAYGGTRLIYGTVQPDPEGKRIIYSQMSDRGIGVFLQDVTTGKKQLIHEKLPTDDEWRSLDVFPWSPDGRYFVFAQSNLFLCDTHSSNLEMELPMEGGGKVQGTRRYGVTSLAWLTPTAFVYVSKLGTLHWYSNNNGQWMEKPSGPKVSASGVMALSSNAIVWHSGSGLWSLNLDTRAAALLAESPVGQITGFDLYGGRFLVNCVSNGVHSLWSVDANAQKSAPQKIAESGGAKSSREFRNVTWLDQDLSGWAGFELDNRNPEAASLIVQLGQRQARPFEGGKVDAFTASITARKLFVVGAVSNEPSAGIWMYDAVSQNLQCLASYSDAPSRYAIRQTALHGQATAKSGRRVDFFLYRPPGFDRRDSKKYPLIIGDTVYRTLDPEYQNRVHGPLWAPMLANCGAYVVIVERSSWMNGIREWTDNVQGVYEELIHDPTVDARRIFLYGTSLETVYLSDLVVTHPDAYAGLFLFDPVRLPNLSSLTNAQVLPSVLLSAGARAHGDGQFERYQKKGMDFGCTIEVYEHAGSGHWLLGKHGMDERSRAIVNFVFRN